MHTTFRELLDLACKVMILALVAIVMLPAAAGEGRTPLYAWTTPITAPGKYIVTRDIFPLVCAAPPIDIQSSNVDIDLNGFRVLACPGKAAVKAVGFDNIAIRNGILGFADHGVEITGAGNRNVVIEDVQMFDMQVGGIYLEGITDFAIRRNNIAGGPTQPAIFVDGNPAPDPVMGTIEGNHVEGGAGGIAVLKGSSVGILNNRIEGVTADGIFCSLFDGGLISENTIQETPVTGILLEDSAGNKLFDNVVRRALDGISLVGASDDNLILNNLSTFNGKNGLFVDTRRNHIDRNVLNNNGQGGAGFGMYLGVGSAGNTFGRNTARGNPGPPPACAFGGGLYAPTTDFCDEALGNTSFADNLMPFLF